MLYVFFTLTADASECSATRLGRFTRRESSAGTPLCRKIGRTYDIPECGRLEKRQIMTQYQQNTTLYYCL